TWAIRPDKQRFTILLRHDVDRRPQNALAMALLEHRKGIASTYYFRTQPCAFAPDIIRDIHSLGHEIGYHYEDWSLARYDKEKAIDSFQRNLDRLRAIAPVRSIVMHGSPLFRQSNMTIWEHYDYQTDGVIDAIRSIDYTDFAYFTDAGRTFGHT